MPCQKEDCDHVVAQIAGALIPKKEFKKAKRDFLKEVNYFNTTTKAVPHPGFMSLFKYCPNCGFKNGKK